ncbi:peptide ligase PGM1-related protein [Paenibacillus sp. SI8]|uniref:peptide ligase PGM1-related protein n=1 Tax=unclassified Paenibacillus TaxID=185978 RepID=UPI0034672432
MADTFHLVNYLTTQRDKGILIWLLNIGAEKYWNRVSAGVVDQNEDMLVNRVEEMNLLLCREQDVLILRKLPDVSYLNALQELGFSIPRMLIVEGDDLLTPISELVLQDKGLQQQLIDISSEREDVYFVPYAVTRLEEQIAENCGLRLIGASSEVNAAVNDKIFNREIAERLELEVCEGKICANVQEIREEYDRLVSSSPAFEKVIIKEPHGASGKGLYIIDSEDKLSSLLGRLARSSRNNPDSKWLVEGWYQKEADVNYQIYIAPDGSVDVFSIKQQILRDTVYIGSKVPADLNDDTLQAYKSYGEKIGAYLFGMGYTGVAGIDSIITSEHTIIPIIEINGRFTLSTYISFIAHVLEEGKVFSRYLKVLSEQPIAYKELKEALEENGILYDRKSGEGVIAYTSGTLPSRRDAGSGKYTGRLFVLIIAKEWDTNERYSTKLEEVVDSLSNRQSLSTT